MVGNRVAKLSRLPTVTVTGTATNAALTADGARNSGGSGPSLEAFGDQSGAAAPSLIADPVAAPRDTPYAPYAVDWRFLPEPLLFAKDLARHHLVDISNATARNDALNPIWVATLGRGALQAVLAAGVLFIHIPKTGGTSIAKLLYRRNLPHYTAAFWNLVYGQRIRRLPSFAVVRHPVDRMLSAYRMAVQGGTEVMAYSRYWRARLKGLESFESFVDHLYDSRGAAHRLPLDLQPQARFVVGADGDIMVDRLFCLDRRTGLAPELRRWLGAADIPHINSARAQPVAITREAHRKIRDIDEGGYALYEQVAAKGGWIESRGLRCPHI